MERALAGNICSSVALVAIQVVAREASPRHEPGGFTGYLGMVSIGIAEDTVVHLAVAG